MKKIILIIIVFVFACTFFSCRKCSQCVAKDKITHAHVSTSDLFCGSSKKIKAKEDGYKASWTTAYDVECSTNK